MDKAQEKYRAILVEIKRRTAVIDAFLSGSTHAVYLPTTVESVCLQVRKILELIAFSSLVANIELYSKQYEKFAENWNAKLMLRDMARVNPDFYPRPIIQNPSKLSGIKCDWADRKDDFLTVDLFIKVYEKCGAMMHADNPYGSKVDYDYYHNATKEWRNRIRNLLSAHIIKLVGDKNIYLFQMGASGAMPSYTAFAPVE